MPARTRPNPSDDHRRQQSSDPAGQTPLQRFRDRVRAGSYDAVIGHGLQSVIRGAAAETGLEPEIGALRVALGRLLNEEDDASKVAAGAARIAAVALQAARLRGGPDSEFEAIRALVLRELDALEQEEMENAQYETGTGTGAANP